MPEFGVSLVQLQGKFERKHHRQELCVRESLLQYVAPCHGTGTVVSSR